jgi:nucleoside triphosphate diphosphatase
MTLEHGSESDSAALFAEAVAIMHLLRRPGGCPWDREQTFDTIQSYTLEETYEVFDAIERRDWNDLAEELGDLLLQVLFYAEMASEAGHFGIADVIHGLNRKLVRRHPHVFGDQAAAEAGNGLTADLPVAQIDSAQVLRNWDAIKKAEKAGRSRGESRLDGIPRAIPALAEARKLGSRARKSGFDWPDVEGLFEKIEEETAELREAIEHETAAGQPGENSASVKKADSPARQAIVMEIGDMLFTVANLARHLEVDPELALRRTNAKFRRRFAQMEAVSSVALEELSPAQLEELWSRAKEAEVEAPLRSPNYE